VAYPHAVRGELQSDVEVARRRVRDLHIEPGEIARLVEVRPGEIAQQLIQ
jgi:hypothetical protein